MRTVLIFPHRGDPPSVPSGYEREAGDPYVLHMVWVSCSHRGKLQGCGGCSSSGPPYCSLKSIVVDQNTCSACKEVSPCPESRS